MPNNTVAGMATDPKQIEYLPTVLESITPQVEVLYLYLNKFPAIPSFLTNYNNIIPLLAKDNYGDLNLTGTMAYLDYVNEKTAYCFTLTDSFIYPPDYVLKMVETLKLFNNKIVVTAQGKIFSAATHSIHMLKECFSNQWIPEQHSVVNFVDSGLCAYHSKNLKLSFDNFIGITNPDIPFTQSCLENKIPLIALKSNKNWLHQINDCPSIQQDHYVIKEKLPKENHMSLKNIKKLWFDFLSENKPKDWLEFAKRNHMDIDMFKFAMEDGPVPVQWRMTSGKLDGLINSFEYVV